MSLQLERVFNGVASLPETEVKTVQEQFGVALQQMETVALDSYDNISTLSIHWKSDRNEGDASNTLVIASRIAKGEFKGPQMSMTYIRDGLMHLAADSDGLDILIVLDCCCAAIAGRGRLFGGKRVELMAATSPGGLSNSREDHPELTFTQRWCTSFENF